MEQAELKNLLESVAQGSIPVSEAVKSLKLDSVDIGHTKIDQKRGLRQGVNEIIYGEGKTPEQIIDICNAMLDADQKRILITRLAKKAARKVSKEVDYAYHENAKLGIVGENPQPSGVGKIVVAAAGTSDLPTAEEAALTAEFLGNAVVRLYDVGVAGIHRLFDRSKDIANAQVIIAVAGMEGALPSVIAGIADCPVIAVPTSVGYGASFGGVTALLAMLNSCASGISVVNIDNGFGAAYQAHLINHPKGISHD